MTDTVQQKIDELKSLKYQSLENLSVEPELNPRTGTPLKPSWLKVDLAHGDAYQDIKRRLRGQKLFTVCEEAKCPNISECWNTGTATFMIMGDTCTRGCRFCAIKTGNPAGLLDIEEPRKTAETIRIMNLSYVVITMVDRDDLPDGGAAHIAETIKQIQLINPKVIIEILAGDFGGVAEPLNTVISAARGVDVFAHNVETVRRLSPRVRDARAKYDQSLTVLANSKKLRPEIFTKSAIMLGLGEEPSEIEETLQDLRNNDVDIVTIGQYLQPTRKHLTVKRFVHPDEFNFWKVVAEKMGFKSVISGPLVRSSYKASEAFPDQSRVSAPAAQ